MIKNLTILTVVFLFALTGCSVKKQPIKFIYLDKVSSKDLNHITSRFGEVVLIENLLEDKDSLFKAQKNYFKLNNKICLLGGNKKYYDMTFYRKSKCTEHFIENEEDQTGTFQTTLEQCGENELFSFFYERDKNNPNMWVANMTKELFGYKYQDTIYCNRN